MLQSSVFAWNACCLDACYVGNTLKWHVGKVHTMIHHLKAPFAVIQDTDDMDYLLPQSITELGNCLMQLAATLIFVSIVQPIFLAGLFPQ